MEYEDLENIDLALKGTTFLSSKHEKLLNYLYEDRIPPSWQEYYLTTKPFGAYISDLIKRVDFFNKWILTNTNGDISATPSKDW